MMPAGGANTEGRNNEDLFATIHATDSSLHDSNNIIPFLSTTVNGSDTDSNNISERDCSSSWANKSKQSKKSQRISRNSLSLTSLPSSITAAASTTNLLVNQLQSSSSDTNSSITLKVLDALAKFQTCLFILSNTVVRLQESLKLIIPEYSSSPSSSDTEPSSISSAASGMPTKAIRPLGGTREFSPGKMPIDNNNIRKGIFVPPGVNGEGKDGILKPETVVSMSNSSSISTCMDTTTNDTLDSSMDSHPSYQSNTCSNQKLPPAPLTRVLSKLVKYIGLFLALFASVCMSLVTLVAKFMDGYSPASKVIWRLQGVLLPSMFIVLYVKYYQKKSLVVWENSTRVMDASKYWKLKILVLLVTRGLVGGLADIFQYYSLKYLPLADSTVISFSTPIFVCLVAHFVLGETLGVVPIFTALLTLCGVIVICRPPILTGQETMNNTVLVGNILAILCMISATFTTVIMRYLKHVHFAMTMLALGIVGTIEGFILTAFTSPFELPRLNYHDILLAALTAGLFFFGQLTQTLALKHEEAGVVSLVRTCDVLFAFIWQVNLLHQKANMYSYIGAIIVTMGVCITALRKWISDMPDHNPIKNRLFFILR